MGRLGLTLLAPGVVALLVAGCGRSGKPRPDLLFVSTRDGVYAIYAMDADGGSQERLLSESLPQGAGPSDLLYEVDPAWSSDGARIAFASNRTGRYEIYLSTAQGAKPTRLTSEPGGATQPTWSHDGKEIAFVRFQPGALYLVPATGGPAHRLSPDQADQADQSYPSWSPDGKQIVFVRRTPGTAIKEVWLINADGTDERQVSHLGASVVSPSWAPDGRQLAFSSNVRGHFELYVIGIDGRGLHRLTDTPSDDVSPAWSPDGKLIAFSRDGAIDTVDLAGKVATLTDSKNNDSSPAWKPLGK